jgi:hypothetical protein
MADNNYSNWWQEYVLPFEPQAAYYSATPFGAGPSAASPFGRDYWQTDPSTQAERAPSQTFVEAGGFSPGSPRRTSWTILAGTRGPRGTPPSARP